MWTLILITLSVTGDRVERLSGHSLIQDCFVARERLLSEISFDYDYRHHEYPESLIIRGYCINEENQFPHDINRQEFK